MALCWLSEPPEVQRGRAVCHTDETSDPHFAIIRCRSEELSITQTQPLIIRLSARLSTDIIDVVSSNISWNYDENYLIGVYPWPIGIPTLKNSEISSVQKNERDAFSKKKNV